MTIRFSIHFNTKWGEELFITGSSPELGNNEIAKAFKLSYTGNSIWQGSIKTSSLHDRIISYKYFVKNADGSIYYEAGQGRKLAPSSATKEITALDQWQGNTSAAPFLSAPFSEVFFANGATPYTQTHKYNHELIIRVTVPNIPQHCRLLLCGNTKETGNWDPSRGLVLEKIEGLKWEGNLNIEKQEGKMFFYKFIIKDDLTGTYTWEAGENRSISLPKTVRNSTIIQEHSAANFTTPAPHFAGVAAPLFSLRSRESHGIGDFSDLKRLIEWAGKCGMSVIQLLPVNDTASHMNWKDSYPYNCISAFAMNPIYLNLTDIGTLNDEKEVKRLATERRLLNHKAFLDYEEVLDSKMKFLRAIYLQEKENTQSEPGYYTFTKQNKEWLFPYAVFCALRDKYRTADFRQWEEHSVYSEELLNTLISRNSEYTGNIHFYIFLQYHLHKQMSSAKEYAHANGIALKGDIPIGVARNGVDAWQYPELFNFTQQAGAPPDAFSEKGQNWGFPPYNWENMEKDNYAWWKARLTHLANYFDAYRIDHILGFFRIWEIPAGDTSGIAGHFHPALPLTPAEIEKAGLAGIAYDGLFIRDPYEKEKFHPVIGAGNTLPYKNLGAGQKQAYDQLSDTYFYRRHNDFWYHNAMKKLQQITASTNMLTCGEDLGMLNESVTRCMHNLRILSLELQQMPKHYGETVANPGSYPYLSVCTTSTHDCETLRLWLGRIKQEFSDITGENGERYYDASPESCTENIKANLAAPSMLAIFPIQDWLSIDGKLRNKYADSERINDPSDPAHYWKYRIHLDLEDLITAEHLNDSIKMLIREAKRG